MAGACDRAAIQLANFLIRQHSAYVEIVAMYRAKSSSTHVTANPLLWLRVSERWLSTTKCADAMI